VARFQVGEILCEAQAAIPHLILMLAVSRPHNSEEAQYWGVQGSQARVSVYSSARTIQLKTPHRHSPDNEWAETLAGRHAVSALNDDPSC
jgi:hypothetical protein